MGSFSANGAAMSGTMDESNMVEVADGVAFGGEVQVVGIFYGDSVCQHMTKHS